MANLESARLDYDRRDQKSAERDDRREPVSEEQDPVWRFYTEHGNGD